ncbi:hypothetical protein [Streptosporangium sp. NPDC087985]
MTDLSPDLVGGFEDVVDRELIMSTTPWRAPAVSPWGWPAGWR